MKKALCAVAGLLLTFSGTAFSAYANLGGNIIDITSFPGGLLIRLDTGWPDNCSHLNDPAKHMVIRETSRAMVATALTTWALGNKAVTVYTDVPSSDGFCIINQLDPAG